MKRRRKAAFEAAIAYFARLRPLLLLGHWRLDFPREAPTNADAAASVQAMERRNIATIRLGEGWYAASREAQRQYAVHELLHLHLARLDFAIGDFARVTDDQSYGIIRTAVSRHLELTVDGLADVLAPLLPLPGEG